MNEENSINYDAIFRVGQVISIQGRVVRIKVDRAKNGSHLLYRGELLRNVGVGGYLKIAKGFSEIIAKVDGESVQEARGSTFYRSARDSVDRVLTVSLVGFFVDDGSFRRGVREMPLVGNECFLLDKVDFDRIHSFAGLGDYPLTIGTLSMEENQEVSVGVSALFASHIGIFGNTGSGKSYTLAKLYHELLSTYQRSPTFRGRARLVLLDFNGEYVNAEGASAQDPHGSVIIQSSLKTEYVLSTRSDSGDRLPMPRSVMEDPVLWTVLLDATEKTQAPFLNRALNREYWEERVSDAGKLRHALGDIVYSAIKAGDPNIDRGMIVKFLEEVELCLGSQCPTELPIYIADIQTNLAYHGKQGTYYYRAPGREYWANTPNDDFYFRQLTFDRLAEIPIGPDALQSLDRIRFKIVLQYYQEVFKGYANREHIAPLIKRLETRMPRIKKLIEVSDDMLLPSPLTVISLRDVSLEMKKVLPLLICRYLYDSKKTEKDTVSYLNIIIDEAHNILSNISSRESEAWKDYRLETFEEMIKEGRKFGVFMTIASQRPHDISETIISQLHNYFLHRLVNNLDIMAIERAVSYLDRVSFDSLPILPTGTCVLSGASTQIPLVVSIDKIAARYEPNNQTMTLADKWHAKAAFGDFIGAKPAMDCGAEDHDLIDDSWGFEDEPPF